MSDWQGESKELFRAARRTVSPSSEDRARVRARVATRLGAAAFGAAVPSVAKAGAVAAGVGSGATAASGGATAGSGAAATTLAAKSGAFALAAKIGVPIVIASTAIGVGAYTARSTSPAVSSRTTTFAATPAVPPGTALATRVVPEPPRASPSLSDPSPSLPVVQADKPSSNSERSPAASPVAARVAAASSPEDTSVAEASLVGAIDGALRTGDPIRAQKLADEHERKFPRGVLAEEREAARVVARCMAEARSPALANAFAAAHPSSPHRARIREACNAEEGSKAP